MPNRYNIQPFVILSDFENFKNAYDEYQTETNQTLKDLTTLTNNYVSNIYINGKNGYIKFINGTIIQWGNSNYPGGSYAEFTVNLVTKFTSANYTVVATARGINNVNASAMKIISNAAASFIVQYTGAGNNSGSVNGITWIAIGK